MVKQMRALFVGKATQRVEATQEAHAAGAARRAGRGAADLAELDGVEPLVRQGVRGGADSRRGGDRRRRSAGAMGPLAGRCPGQPAALPPDPGQRRRRGAAGKEARPARRVDRVFRPGPAAASSGSGRDFSGRTARDRSRRSTWHATWSIAPIRIRRGTRPGGPTCSTGSRSPTRRVSRFGSTMHRSRRARGCWGRSARRMPASTAAWRLDGPGSAAGERRSFPMRRSRLPTRSSCGCATTCRPRDRAGQPSAAAGTSAKLPVVWRPEAIRHRPRRQIGRSGAGASEARSSEFARCGCRRASRRSAH